MIIRVYERSHTLVRVGVSYEMKISGDTVARRVDQPQVLAQIGARHYVKSDEEKRGELPRFLYEPDPNDEQTAQDSVPLSKDLIKFFERCFFEMVYLYKTNPRKAGV